MPTERRPATEAEARALASALRLRIIRLCHDRCLTNRELAHLLATNPATMLHHVRKLVDTGFLVAEPARRGKRGSREVPYRSTGKSWRLDIGEHDKSSQAVLDAYLQEVGLVDLDRTYLVRLGLRLSEKEYAEVTRRLHDLLEEFASNPASDESRAYSLYLNLHPDVTRDAAG
ncbi:MAG TPA: winged helix-turn-helix domain-containing protein [Micromonosporaceae bacterium]|jgi:Mn-dependent DtxR family transcriptional regulator